MSFNDSIQRRKLKNKTTSNTKYQNILSSLSLSDVKICLRDGPLSSDVGIVNLHFSKATHWIAYINEIYFGSYGFSTPQKLSRSITKLFGHCFCCEYKVQGLTNKRNSFCSAYPFYANYLTIVLGIDFKSAVLNLCSQTVSQK